MCKHFCHFLPVLVVFQTIKQGMWSPRAVSNETFFNALWARFCGRGYAWAQKRAYFWPLGEITLSRYHEAVYAAIRPLFRKNWSPFSCR